jgi:hypothetical protein
MRLRAAAPTAGGAGDAAGGRVAAGTSAPCSSSSGGTWDMHAPCICSAASAVHLPCVCRASGVLCIYCASAVHRACTERAPSVHASSVYLRCTCMSGRLQLGVREA